MFKSLERKFSQGSEQERVRAYARLARWAGVGRDRHPLRRLLPLLRRHVVDDASRYLPHTTGAILSLEGATSEVIDRISRIGYRCDQSIEVLGRALSHPLPLLRRIARQALDANISTASIRDGMLRLLTDPRRDVRDSAAKNLLWNDAALPQDLEQLQALTKDVAPRVRGLAYRNLGKRLERCVEQLLPGLSDPVDEVRFRAGIALSSTLSAAVKAVPVLTHLLGRSRWDRRAALRSIASLTERRKGAVLPLLRCVGSSDWLISQEAARSLLGDFRALDAHRSRLLRLLRNPVPHVRAHAIGLLRLLVDDRNLTAGLLAKALRDPEAQVRKAAVRGLEILTPESPQLVEELRSSLKRARLDRKIHVALALQALNAPPPDLVRLLSRGVGSACTDVRLDSLSALGDLGPRARPALASICKAVNDRDINVRSRAVGALEQLGPPGVTAIRPLLNHREELIRNFARCALHRVDRR